MKARREYAIWKCRSVSIRNDWKLPPMGAPGSSPWTSRRGIKLAGLPRGERVLDTVDVCFQVACKQNPGMSVKELIDTLWCNPSQMVHWHQTQTKKASKNKNKSWPQKQLSLNKINVAPPFKK